MCQSGADSPRDRPAPSSSSRSSSRQRRRPRPNRGAFRSGPPNRGPNRCRRSGQPVSRRRFRPVPEPSDPADPILMAGSILGLRLWRTDSAFETLFSGMTGARWQTDGRATSATCIRHDRGRHRAPGKDCSCGLYAHHPNRFPPQLSLRISRPYPRVVIGLVEAWGRIELHRQGFRAEFARPVAFVNYRWNPPVGLDEETHQEVFRRHRTIFEYRLAELAERCDAEIIDPNEGDRLGAWIRNDGRAISPALLRELVPERPPRRRRPRPG